MGLCHFNGMDAFGLLGIAMRSPTNRGAEEGRRKVVSVVVVN